jgi:aspartyl/asparaginyl-tRNA synthetase
MKVHEFYRAPRCDKIDFAQDLFSREAFLEPEIAFADLSDNAALAEALLKYTFAALRKEREE